MNLHDLCTTQKIRQIGTGTAIAIGFSPEIFRGKEPKMISTLMLVILVVLLLGAVPAWPHSANWGYGPSGILGVVLLVVLLLLLTGRI